MECFMKRFACMYLVIGAILFASPLYGAVKFSRGEKNIIVVTGKNPAGSVKFAASELARFLGAALKSKVVVQEQMAEGKCIVLGSSGKADAAENVIEEKDGKLWIYGSCMRLNPYAKCAIFDGRERIGKNRTAHIG